MKLALVPQAAHPVWVAPSRGRGLKHCVPAWRGQSAGRPFTGAWIETILAKDSLSDTPSRPFTGAWIETLSKTT